MHRAFLRRAVPAQHLQPLRHVCFPYRLVSTNSKCLQTTKTIFPISTPRRRSKHNTLSSIRQNSFVTSVLGGDTIYALSTPKGKSGIAVIRISGPSCKDLYRRLCPGTTFPKPRFAAVRTLYHPLSANEEILDSQALVLYFPNPRTVTGEDVLELHIHGGSATVKAVLSAIPKSCEIGKIRYAEPGEFTKRAFLNNRLDLAQVEALSETLSAETEQQRLAATRGHSGALGRTYEEWRHLLLQARAEMEALIDFSEDQHFDESPVELTENVTKQIQHIVKRIKLHMVAGERSELIRKGIKIALLGPPNVGKSSLMNQLLGREASIVSDESGTTRDVIEASLDIRGYLCTFADTAGFRTAQGGSFPGMGPESSVLGAIEQEGIRRARAKALESDLIVVLTSVEKTSSGGHLIYYDQDTLHLAANSPRCILVVNKRDSLSEEDMDLLLNQFRNEVLSKSTGLGSVTPVLVSCKEAREQADTQTDPGGIGSVADSLVSAFSEMTSLPSDLQELHGVTERQSQLLELCRESLEAYMDVTRAADSDNGVSDGADADIAMAAEHLRWAAIYLGRITGRGDSGDVEEVLGVIFEK